MGLVVRSLIVAISQNGVIGVDNDMPWKHGLPEDLKRFKQLTMGHHLIMGHKTFKSIGRPLPGRTTIVLTRGNGVDIPHHHNVAVAHNLESALNLAENTTDDEIFICGGAEVYTTALALDVVDRIYLTLVMRDFVGDTRLDLHLSPDSWEVTFDERHEDVSNGSLPYRFQTLDRHR